MLRVHVPVHMYVHAKYMLPPMVYGPPGPECPPPMRMPPHAPEGPPMWIQKLYVGMAI